MPIWKPGPIVEAQEMVGRRYFDKVGHQRELDKNGHPLPKMEDFLETRESDDLSFDRLGNPNPNADTLRAITRIADEDAGIRSPARIFNGWATVRVRDFRFKGFWAASITARPVLDTEGNVVNPWHAEVSREGNRNKMHIYTFSISLAHLFEMKGRYAEPVRAT